MNTRLHLGPDEARSLIALPLNTLSWMERMALEMDLPKYRKQSQGHDSWYVSQGGEAFGPMPFREVVQMLLRGEGPLPVLHESEAQMDPQPWNTLSYRPWPFSPTLNLGWIICCWLFAIAAGFALVTLLSPVPVRTFVGLAYLSIIVIAGGWLGLQARGRGGPRPTDAPEEDRGMENPQEDGA